MAITYQFNKTSLQGLEKNLKMRQRTLPTLQNKESALRLEVKKAKAEIKELDDEVNRRIKDYDQMLALWGEFDTSLINVDDVRMSIKKIAGVRVPVLDEVVYSTKEFSLFSSPKWFIDGFEQLKAIAEVGIRQEFVRRKVDLLEYARKKTTQKVNLFEKVQIPGYQDAIRKIKRFMEDEENLSKAVREQARMLFQAGVDFEELGDESPTVSRRKDKAKVKSLTLEMYEKAVLYYSKAQETGYPEAAERIAAVKEKMATLAQ